MFIIRGKLKAADVPEVLDYFTYLYPEVERPPHMEKKLVEHLVGETLNYKYGDLNYPIYRTDKPEMYGDLEWVIIHV